jgi:SP family arabinose:H+ symporter-like MFS transporter
MNQHKLLFWSITVALAGFLFGFDTVVISGADQALQEMWQSSSLFHGVVVMSSALWGTVIGALFGSIPTDRLGRKKTLILIGFLYIIGAAGSALVSDPWLFAAFRFLGGLGVGASTIAAPAYVSEIAPPDKRGRLVAMYQFNIVFGILMAYLSNFMFTSLDLGANTWRWMLGIQVLPAIIYTLMVLTVPMSPRWLMMKGRYEEARAVLKQINPDADFEELAAAAKADSAHKKESLWLKKYRTPVLLAFLIAFFNQVSGINAFLYYAPRIFEIAGLEKSAAMLSSVGIGIVNLIFTFVGLASNRQIRPPPIDVYRLVWLYYFFGLGIAGLFHALARHGGAAVFLPLYRGARHRPGHGDLGVYFRNFPRPPARSRPIARQLHPLGAGRRHSRRHSVFV